MAEGKPARADDAAGREAMSALDGYPPAVQLRIRDAWFNDDVGREDLRKRFAMAESVFQRLVAELGRRPRIVVSFARGGAKRALTRKR